MKTATESNLKRHIEFVHKNKASNKGIKLEKKYKCPFCDVEEYNLKLHLETKHKDKLNKYKVLPEIHENKNVGVNFKSDHKKSSTNNVDITENFKPPQDR